MAVIIAALVTASEENEIAGIVCGFIVHIAVTFIRSNP